MLNLARNLRTQFRTALHRRVLIVAGDHRRRYQLRNARIDVVVGESLPQVERTQLARAARHDGEYRRADIGQLAGDGQGRRPRNSGDRRQRRTDDARLAGKLCRADLRR
jgi:hypothetical protein